jgi:genome maintenance exonuclease 1
MNLPKLRSIEIPELGRFYESPTSGDWYPSVTTVTGFEKKEFWAKWRSDPKNMAISQQSISRGNKLHEIAEAYLKQDHAMIKAAPLGDKTLFMLIKKNLDKITNIYGQEQPLWSDTLRLAGRFDCIADYDGEISIIDFKSSRREKRKSDIENYFQQACAYAHMWLECTGQKKLPRTVILIACDSGVDQEFIEDSKKAREGLKNAINLYWTHTNFEELQERIKNELAKETIVVG